MVIHPSFGMRLYAALLVVIGAVLVYGGVVLARLGGSLYYLPAGLAVIASGVLLWRGRRLGATLYGAMLAATVTWAIWEAGLDGWALTARLAGPMVLGLALLTPWARRSLNPPRLRQTLGWGRLALVGVMAVAAGIGLHAAWGPGLVDPAYQAGTQPVSAVTPRPSGFAADAGEWRHYGNDPAGTRFSGLTQLTPETVGRLQVAWTVRVGAAPNGELRPMESVPLKIGPNLYTCTGYNDVIALNAETGRQVWRFAAKVDVGPAPYGECRGVSHYAVPGATGLCAERIYTNTLDARLIALDLQTGQLCPGFGENGVVDLRAGLGADSGNGLYYVSSAPTISHGKIVLGGWVSDNQKTGEPSGVIRAFDAVTGQLAWAFDAGRPERMGAPEPGETYTKATPNSWAPMSADDDAGLVFAPTGVSTPDYWGVDRREFDEKYASGVVALDIETGRPRWVFQTVHHDLWDYDVASQPTLADIPDGQGGVHRALIQATKRGEIFVLDRLTGQPIAPVTEHAVPQDGKLAEETLAPTQPFSDAMPSFRGPDLTEASMWGLTPLDQMFCRIYFRSSRYEGSFTPPGLTQSIAYPGYLGGMNWGGVSVDRDRHLMIVNSDRMAVHVRMVPRAETLGKNLNPHGGSPQIGTPYAVELGPFMSPLFVPCQQPPWGMISAVDLVTRKLVWTRPFGTARDSGPWGLPSMIPLQIGTPNLGGSVTTRGGLVFIAASHDRFLRAFDSATGKLLWQGRLPAGGQSTPMTYLSEESGRQFVVVGAGGHVFLGVKPGDYLIAYAVPKAGGK